MVGNIFIGLFGAGVSAGFVWASYALAEHASSVTNVPLRLWWFVVGMLALLLAFHTAAGTIKTIVGEEE